ncbi:S-acyltransferas, putative [Babesia caballi]|uniref:S-acyltransferas, putative n=1 Tax=Babesia caballi TaxID=5871 RepID=A0AAV4M2Q1_BABCB|nr:S-acyltransferas, putative [Babesia caballi]
MAESTAMESLSFEDAAAYRSLPSEPGFYYGDELQREPYGPNPVALTIAVLVVFAEWLQLLWVVHSAERPWHHLWFTLVFSAAIGLMALLNKSNPGILPRDTGLDRFHRDGGLFPLRLLITAAQRPPRRPRSTTPSSSSAGAKCMHNIGAPNGISGMRGFSAEHPLVFVIFLLACLRLPIVLYHALGNVYFVVLNLTYFEYLTRAYPDGNPFDHGRPSAAFRDPAAGVWHNLREFWALPWIDLRFANASHFLLICLQLTATCPCIMRLDFAAGPDTAASCSAPLSPESAAPVARRRPA